MAKKELGILPEEDNGLLSAKVHRRNFLSKAVAFTAVGYVVSACKKNNSSSGGIDLGSGDTGILNYAYALEQLEAAFYIQVVQSLYSGATATEQAYLTDIRDHEIAHREFFKKVLAGSAIPDLEVNFSSINFSSRDSVLATSKAFEDLGVAAYNGAGKLLTSPDNLLVAGKIVSVEARHAALIRDLISNGTFADNTVVNANGLDVAKSPSEVLGTASAFLKSKLNGNNLPTS